jgi:hypothetical protein
VSCLGYPAHPGAAPPAGGAVPAAGSLFRARPAAPGSDPDPPTSPFPGSCSGHPDILSRPSAPRTRFGGGPGPHHSTQQPGTPSHRDSPLGTARNHVTPHPRSGLSLRAFLTRAENAPACLHPNPPRQPPKWLRHNDRNWLSSHDRSHHLQHMGDRCELCWSGGTGPVRFARDCWWAGNRRAGRFLMSTQAFDCPNQGFLTAIVPKDQKTGGQARSLDSARPCGKFPFGSPTGEPLR